MLQCTCDCFLRDKPITDSMVTASCCSTQSCETAGVSIYVQREKQGYRSLAAQQKQVLTTSRGDHGKEFMGLDHRTVKVSEGFMCMICCFFILTLPRFLYYLVFNYICKIHPALLLLQIQKYNIDCINISQFSGFGQFGLTKFNWLKLNYKCTAKYYSTFGSHYCSFRFLTLFECSQWLNVKITALVLNRCVFTWCWGLSENIPPAPPRHCPHVPVKIGLLFHVAQTLHLRRSLGVR